MLPDFDDNGHLPAGIHRCTIEEVVDRFGTGSLERVTESQELLALAAWCRRAGIRRLLVNGSYVSAKRSPNDVDIVIPPGPDYPREESPLTENVSRWPFLQILVALDDADFECWALKDFGTDRRLAAKGVIEVEL